MRKTKPTTMRNWNKAEDEIKRAQEQLDVESWGDMSAAETGEKIETDGKCPQSQRGVIMTCMCVIMNKLFAVETPGSLDHDNHAGWAWLTPRAL